MTLKKKKKKLFLFHAGSPGAQLFPHKAAAREDRALPPGLDAARFSSRLLSGLVLARGGLGRQWPVAPRCRGQC